MNSIALALVINTILAGSFDVGPAETYCMAENVYHEARGEDIVGQIAVAQVVINRATISGRTLCQEIHRPNQFSWTISGRAEIDDYDAFQKSLIVALHVMTTNLVPAAGDADHYFNPSKADPSWRHEMQPYRTFGNHLFLVSR